MKLCQTCHKITADEKNYCAYDGHLLVPDLLATALQESVGAKYTVSRLIGTGSMGAVYCAQHHALDNVAIKVMLGPPDNQKLSERFLREARALRKLRHPHAVLVYDLERSPTGLTYMVMEMVEGRSLRDELLQRGPLSLPETLTMADAVCDALEAAHERGIIHRDLKPDNILMAEEKTVDGEVSRVIKIVDFGIVKLRGTQQGGEEVSMQLTKSGTPIGTPFYMSPEQWFGDGPGFTALDGRTDIYALGCTLYEALSGRPPFLAKTKDALRQKHLNETARPLSEIAPHVPEAVSRVIARTLEKDRDFRPSSAAEFAAELRRAYEESTGQTRDADEERSSATPEAASLRGLGEGSSAAQTSQLQTTEETVPVVRNWAVEEAQEMIERVRARGQSRVAQPIETRAATHDNGQRAAEQKPEPPPIAAEDFEATIVPGKFRFAAEAITPQQAGAPVDELELRETLELPTTPKAERPDETTRETKREARDLMVAQAGLWRIGIFSDEVESVNDWRWPVPLPQAPPAVLGVISVHGRMLTVLDPAALLDDQSGSGSFAPSGFIIALRGDEQLALAVNRVERNVEIYLDEISAPVEGAASGVACGVVRIEHQRTVLLDTRELFAATMHGAERRRQRT